jgi:hypothetical protein
MAMAALVIGLVAGGGIFYMGKPVVRSRSRLVRPEVGHAHGLVPHIRVPRACTLLWWLMPKGRLDSLAPRTVHSLLFAGCT